MESLLIGLMCINFATQRPACQSASEATVIQLGLDKHFMSIDKLASETAKENVSRYVLGLGYAGGAMIRKQGNVTVKANPLADTMSLSVNKQELMTNLTWRF